MDFFSAMSISSSGLAAQRTRMNIISTNLANAATTRTPEGGPYRRKEAVFVANPVQVKGFEAMFAPGFEQELRSVMVGDIVEDPRPPRLVYDPSHPDANTSGYVLMPNINTIEEMVNLISATRSYESNVMAINALKTMAMRALQIGQ